MTADTRSSSSHGRTSDWAVQGLLSGFIASLGIMSVLVVAGLFSGISIGEAIARFDPTNGGTVLTGLLANLAVSGIYGLIFGLIYRLTIRSSTVDNLPSWVVGSVYGLLLYIVALLVLPLNQSGLLAFSAGSLLLGHIVYGGALGFFMTRLGTNHS